MDTKEAIDAAERKLNHLFRQLKVPPALAFFLFIATLTRSPTVELFGSDVPYDVGFLVIAVVSAIIYADCGRTVSSIERIAISTEKSPEVFEFCRKKSGLFNPFSEDDTVYDVLGILLINVPFLLIIFLFSFPTLWIAYMHTFEPGVFERLTESKSQVETVWVVVDKVLAVLFGVFFLLMIVSFFYFAGKILCVLQAIEYRRIDDANFVVDLFDVDWTWKMIVHGISAFVLVSLLVLFVLFLIGMGVV